MRRPKKTKVQYTKKALTAVLAVTLLDLQLSYILALLDKNPLEDIAKTLIIEVIGVFLIYCVKSFFETKEEKKQETEDNE